MGAKIDFSVIMTATQSTAYRYILLPLLFPLLLPQLILLRTMHTSVIVGILLIRQNQQQRLAQKTMGVLIGTDALQCVINEVTAVGMVLIVRTARGIP